MGNFNCCPNTPTYNNWFLQIPPWSAWRATSHENTKTAPVRFLRENRTTRNPKSRQEHLSDQVKTMYVLLFSLFQYYNNKNIFPPTLRARKYQIVLLKCLLHVNLSTGIWHMQQTKQLSITKHKTAISIKILTFLHCLGLIFVRQHRYFLFWCVNVSIIAAVYCMDTYVCARVWMYSMWGYLLYIHRNSMICSPLFLLFTRILLSLSLHPVSKRNSSLHPQVKLSEWGCLTSVYTVRRLWVWLICVLCSPMKKRGLLKCAGTIKFIERKKLEY